MTESASEWSDSASIADEPVIAEATNFRDRDRHVGRQGGDDRDALLRGPVETDISPFSVDSEASCPGPFDQRVDGTPMATLPSAAVILLWRDGGRRTTFRPDADLAYFIEGSTRLLQDLGERYEDLLADHHRLLRTAFVAHAGTELGAAGDGFYFRFTGARDALSAAVEAQRALGQALSGMRKARAHRPSIQAEPRAAEVGLVGLDVHIAARIGAAGSGGQILLSQTTRELVAGRSARGRHVAGPRGAPAQGHLRAPSPVPGDRGCPALEFPRPAHPDARPQQPATRADHLHRT